MHVYVDMQLKKNQLRIIGTFHANDIKWLNGRNMTYFGAG